VCASRALKLPSPVGESWAREAEKKHGRVAMVAVPTLLAIHMATGEDPVRFLNAQPASTQLTFYALAGTLESLNLRRFDRGFALKPDAEPGKLLPVDAPAQWRRAEDQAGRVAMLIAACFFSASLAA
jgi:hypothetical protein